MGRNRFARQGKQWGTGGLCGQMRPNTGLLGSPAVLGRALRPVALRLRLSVGLPLSSKLSIRWGESRDKSVLTIRKKSRNNHIAEVSVNVKKRKHAGSIGHRLASQQQIRDPAFCLNISCTFGIMQTDLPRRTLDFSQSKYDVRRNPLKRRITVG